MSNKKRIDGPILAAFIGGGFLVVATLLTFATTFLLQRWQSEFLEQQRRIEHDYLRLEKMIELENSILHESEVVMPPLLQADSLIRHAEVSRASNVPLDRGLIAVVQKDQAVRDWNRATRQLIAILRTSRHYFGAKARIAIDNLLESGLLHRPPKRAFEKLSAMLGYMTAEVGASVPSEEQFATLLKLGGEIIDTANAYQRALDQQLEDVTRAMAREITTHRLE